VIKVSHEHKTFPSNLNHPKHRRGNRLCDEGRRPACRLLVRRGAVEYISYFLKGEYMKKIIFVSLFLLFAVIANAETCIYSWVKVDDPTIEIYGYVNSCDGRLDMYEVKQSRAYWQAWADNHFLGSYDTKEHAQKAVEKYVTKIVLHNKR
jgi:hypothetical protein